MNIDKDLKEWIELFCLFDNTNYMSLSEVRMFEIIELLKEDKYNTEQIDEAINKYYHKNYE